MNESGKSDKPVVPAKPANTNWNSFWEFFQYVKQVEGRGLAKDKDEDQILAIAEPAKQVDGTQRPLAKGEDLHSALDRIRQAACRDKGLQFTTLWHHVYDVHRLREAYFACKHDAAAGVDGQSWQAYGQELEDNLHDLSERLANGKYQAKPVKRVYIPKADGKQRPIGIPVLEDKIVQRATVKVLNAIYETDFLGFSYGFRPGRSAHRALDALAVGIQSKKVNWLLDADIRRFFDTLSHECLIQFLQQRIADNRVVRHIQKWLNAGVLEEGKRVQAEEGTPQGGSISPLLANIYLHYVFDLWAEQWRRTRAHGDVIIVRYADDFVVGFQHESDAKAFLAELRERFAQFNLELHADKTRIIEFGRFAAERREARGQGKPMTFNFLGFTHVCDKTRAGKFIVLRRTMAQRMRRKLGGLKETLRRAMHRPLNDVGRWLGRVVGGHYRYYGVPRNYPALNLFRDRVRRLWQRTLSRRSQKGRIGEACMSRIANCWLPRPHICHPYPEARLAS